MGSIAATRAAAKRKKRQLPNDYVCTPKEEQAYLYCVKNDIRISPIGVQGTLDQWYIGISTPEDYKRVYNSPETCDRHSVWQIFYKYCNYYYEKSNSISNVNG